MLPPGQHATKKWIIYAALGIPRIELSSWRLGVKGLVERPLLLTYDELSAMPMRRYSRPFHCVTGWSVLQAEWEGVPISHLAGLAGLRPEASWAMFRCVDGYSAPVPIQDALSEDALVVLKLNGEPLKPEQGFPARPFIPHLYGWKSAKWLTEIEFLGRYEDGYWEVYGYHERGHVWHEERFKGSGGRHARRRPFGTLDAFT
jgi:DMSO/TMAO reductase YedYZ molybdopterin-dependent catalytic subunit